jgi:lipoprotein LprG
VGVRRWIRAGAGVGLLPALLLGLAACGGGSSGKAPSVDAQTLLQKAKTTADATAAVHFSLTSSDVSGSGTNIVGGQGDLARPDAMQGSFTVTLAGVQAGVKVVSKGGVFEAQLPFSSHYTKTNPAAFGLTDPSELLDPTHGLTSLLVSGTNAHSVGQKRVGGELVDEVTETVPGKSIPVLPDLNPSKPVTLTAAIDPSNFQLRQVTLVGPFTSSSDTTYVLTLTNYDEKVSIALPSVT